MSEINVNTIDKATGSTLNVGAAGTTVNIAGTAGTGFPAGTTLSGSTNNTVVTVTGANAIQGEANLTFDGTDLDVGASCKISSNGAIANFSNHNGSATETTLATSDGNEKVRCFNDGKITIETGGSERMRVTSGGNLLVGSSLAATGYARVSLVGGHTDGTGANSGIQMTYNSGAYGGGAITTPEAAGGGFKFWNFTGNVGSESYSEKMRISANGQVSIGDFSGDARLLTVNAGGTHTYAFRATGYTTETVGAFYNNSANGTHKIIQFFDGQAQECGSISVNTNANTTAYTTSSDYRLKENIVDLDNATTRLKELKPKRFNFIKDETNTLVDGFLAHEVSDIIPEAITGTKDATVDKVKVVLNNVGEILDEKIEEADWEQGKLEDKDGNIKYPNDTTWEAEKTVPVYQGIDQAKLVPLLTKALQEAITKIETLETKVTALENA